MVDFANLVIKADSSEARSAKTDLKGLRSEGAETEKTFMGLSATTAKLGAALAGAFAVVLSGGWLTSAINEASMFEQSMAKVEAVIKATNGVAGLSAEQLREQARSLALSTLQSTEGVLEAQRVLLTFRSIQGETFDRTIRAANDMATALGTSLTGSVIQLAKALEDPVKGISALSRSGTVFTDVQKEMVKGMVEAGDQAAAQDFILSELEAQYKGTAEAAAQGLAGAQDTLGQRIQELKLEMVDQLNLLNIAASAYNGLANIVLLVSENLRRVIFYVGSAATALSVAFAPAILGAALALGRLVVGLVLTRAALIRTGIGAVVVLVGELAFRLDRLVDRLGSTGTAFSLLKDVAVESFERVGWAFNYVSAIAETASMSIAASFFEALASVTNSFFEATEFIREKLESLGITVGSMGAGMKDSMSALATEARAAAVAIGGTAEAMRKAMVAPMVSVQALSDALSQADKKAGNAEVTVTELETATAELDTTLLDAATAGEELSKVLTDKVTPAAEKMGDSMTQTIKSSVDSSVAYMIDGFKDGFRGLFDIFKQGLTRLVTTAAQNQIMIGLGMNAAGGTAASAAGAVGGAGGGAGMIGTASSLFGLATSSFGAGAASVVSGLFSGGLAGAGTAIGTAVSGASAGLAGLATAAGAVALPLAAVAIGITAFQTKTKELDHGLRVTAEGADSLVESFRRVRKSKFFGLSSSTSTGFEDADRATSDPIERAYARLFNSTKNLADGIGANANRLEGFTTQMDISLKGLSEEDAQQAVQGMFKGLANRLARVTLAGTKTVRIGEQASDALARLSSALGVAANATDMLGVSVFDISIESAKAASRLVDAAGGLDALAQSTDFFFQNFYSDVERADTLTRRLGQGFSALGLTLPKSAKKFRSMVEHALNTGRMERAGALLNLAPAFKEMLTLQGQVQDSLGATGGAFAGVAESFDAAIPDNSRLQEEMTLRRRIWTLTGQTHKLRADEIAGTQKSNRHLVKRIHLLEDEAAVAAEREGLEVQLLRLQGKTRQLRELEIEKLDKSNHSLQLRIWRLEDEAAINQEREGLETELLRLQGDTAELRRRELLALNPANRALQIMIWGLEDAKGAVEETTAALAELEPERFATLFDFERAKRLRDNGLDNPSIFAPPRQPPSAGDSAEVVAARSLKEEMAALRDESRQLGIQIERHTRETASTLNRFDKAGMPPVRS